MGHEQPRPQEGDLVPAARLSRYEFAPIEVDTCGRVFLDVPDPIPRVVRPSDLRAMPGQGDTLFGVAWKAYRDLLDREQDIRPTSFWDVIAQVNNLIDARPILVNGDLTLEPGKVLRVPNIENLTSEIRVPPAFFETGTVVVVNE